MPSESADNGQDEPVGSTIAEETVRIETVRYLEGASGHAVLSLVVILVAGVLLYQDRRGVAVVVLLVAYGVALNGLSIFIWDKLRVYFESTLWGEHGETAPRTLAPHRVSTAMKAELAAGAAMVAGFILFLLLVLSLFRTLGSQHTLILAVGGLMLGCLAGLGWAYKSG